MAETLPLTEVEKAARVMLKHYKDGETRNILDIDAQALESALKGMDKARYSPVSDPDPPADEPSEKPAEKVKTASSAAKHSTTKPARGH